MKVLFSFLVFFFFATVINAKKNDTSVDSDVIAYDDFSGHEYGWSGYWNKMYLYGNHYGIGYGGGQGHGYGCGSYGWAYNRRYWWNYYTEPEKGFSYSKGEVTLEYSHWSGISIDGGDECLKAVSTAQGSQSTAVTRKIQHHKELKNTFYVSFLARFSERPTKGWDYVAVGSKRFGLDAGVALGSIYYEKKIGAAFGLDGHERASIGQELPKGNQTYFIVGKFITNRYGAVEAIKIFVNPTSLTEEKSAWKARVKSDVLIGKMHSLDLQAYFHDVAYFDEVRIGKTWNSVVSSINNVGTVEPEKKITKFKGPSGYWKEKDKWSNGLPDAETDTVVIEGECAVDEEVVAKDIVVEGSGKLVLVNGGKINTENPIVLKAEVDVSAEYEQEDLADTYIVEKQEFFLGGQWNFVCVPQAMTADELFPDLKLASSWSDPEADYWLLDYSQEQRAATKDGMVDIYDGTYQLTEGRGYIVWLDQDKVRTFQYTSSKSETTVSTTNNTSTPVSLNHAGWNLVGNPFSHTVSYEDVFDNSPHNQKYFTGAVYVWDGSDYKVWSNGVGDEEAREIKPMEAFFVKRTSDDPAAAMFYMSKSSSQTTVEAGVVSKSTEIQDAVNSLSVSINLMKGEMADYTYINIDERASVGLDEELDGLKLNTSSAYHDCIYSKDGNNVFAVNSVSLDGDFVEVPLVVNLAQGMDSILLGFALRGDRSCSFALVDEDEMTMRPIEHGSLLKLKADYEGKIEGRFSVFVTKAENTETAIDDVAKAEFKLGNVRSEIGTLVLESLASEKLSYAIIGVDGVIYDNDVIVSGEKKQERLKRGVYLIRLSDGVNKEVHKVLVP